MGRREVYTSSAQRQRAYRERTKPKLATGAPGQKPAQIPGRRRPSRPARLAKIENELLDLLQEYEGWLESLPASLGQSDQAARLAETIERLASVADAVAAIDLPRGFGRD